MKTNIVEIDDYELRFLPMFSTFIAQLKNVVARLKELRASAGPKMLGYGAFKLLHFVARLVSITADVKNAVFRFAAQSKKAVTKTKLDWFGQSGDAAVEEAAV